MPEVKNRMRVYPFICLKASPKDSSTYTCCSSGECFSDMTPGLSIEKKSHQVTTVDGDNTRSAHRIWHPHSNRSAGLWPGDGSGLLRSHHQEFRLAGRDEERQVRSLGLCLGWLAGEGSNSSWRRVSAATTGVARLTKCWCFGHAGWQLWLPRRHHKVGTWKFSPAPSLNIV